MTLNFWRPTTQLPLQDATYYLYKLARITGSNCVHPIDLNLISVLIFSTVTPQLLWKEKSSCCSSHLLFNIANLFTNFRFSVKSLLHTLSSLFSSKPTSTLINIVVVMTVPVYSPYGMESALWHGISTPSSYSRGGPATKDCCSLSASSNSHCPGSHCTGSNCTVCHFSSSHFHCSSTSGTSSPSLGGQYYTTPPILPPSQGGSYAHPVVYNVSAIQSTSTDVGFVVQHPFLLNLVQSPSIAIPKTMVA